MNENYNDCNQRKTTSTFLYMQKAKINAKRFYKQKKRHFSKSKTMSITFLYTKSLTLYVTRFFMKFWNGNLYTKSMTLFVMWCLYIQKYTHFEKFKTIWITFFYTKSLTLYVTQFFMGFLKLAEGGEGYEQEIMHFSLIRLYAKNNALPDTFYKKPETLRHFLIFKTKCTLCYVLYIKCMV